MTQKRYLADLRSIAYGFWNGTFNQAAFQDLMFNAIDRWLTIAWQEGAKQVGILPDEITPTEQVKLMTVIFREYSFVPGLAAFIIQNSKANNGSRAVVYQRIATWANRYADVVNRAKAEAEKDPKLRWVVGPTSDSCRTCQRLNGKIKRASWWRDNVMPQQPDNPNLECRGFRCLCSLEPTDEPMSRGRMPNVP